MDSYHTLHLLSMLSDSLIWYNVIRLSRSILLDESDSGF